MVDGKRARTTSTRTRRPRKTSAEIQAGKILAQIKRVPSADSVVAASEVARRLRGADNHQALPLTIFPTVTKVLLHCGWVPTDPNTVAIFRGPDRAPWITFRSDGEAITAPLSLVALKEGRRLPPSVVD